MLSQHLELEAKWNVVKYGRDEDFGLPLEKSEGHDYHVA